MPGNARIDRNGLVDWARDRFGIELSIDDLKNKQREEIRSLLIAHSRDTQQRGMETLGVVKDKIDALFKTSEGNVVHEPRPLRRK